MSSPRAASRRRTAILASCALAIAIDAAAQDGGWNALEVPGGRATLQRLGVEESRDRAGVMIELIRRLHFSTSRPNDLETELRRIPSSGSGGVTLPLPMAPEFWQTVILQRSLPASALFGAILNDRGARLLYHAIAGMDAGTRAWLQKNPELLRSIYRNATALQSFALFAPALRVANGRVEVAGGAEIGGRWSEVLNASVDEPARFASRLFLERDGRIAGLYFLSAFVDAARREFLTRGGDRFAALVTSFASCYPRQSNDYPFVLRSKDPAFLLLSIGITSDGRPAGPRARGFWRDVFAEDEAFASQKTDATPIDAAWMVDRLCTASTIDRARVFDTLLAGHRTFAGAASIDERSAMLALRARRLYPAVFVAIERAGIRNPIVFATAGRHAQSLDRLDDLNTTPAALQQFQGALALVLGAARANTLSEGAVSNVIFTLCDVRVSDGRYDGRMAAWFEKYFVPALRSAIDREGTLTVETLIARALGGVPSARPTAVTWEEIDYLIDEPASIRDRLLAVRERQGGDPLDRALEMARQARDDAAIRAADAALGRALASWVYAPLLGQANGGALVGGDPSSRHDLGLRQVNRTRFEQRWEVPIAPGGRGQVSASYLAMDAAMAGWSLRRLAADRIPAPTTLTENDRWSLVSALAFSSARQLSDEAMHRIADAIASGTRQVDEARADAAALDALADRASLSPWRRNVLPWMIRAEPERIADVFSPTARARLAGLETAPLAEWGTSGVPEGCLCLRPPPASIPELIIGRPVDGIVGAYSADLTFRLAQLLTELGLPAQLFPSVMAYALRDYLDAVRPMHPADTDAFARESMRLTRTMVEDYVGAIAAVGPLRPAQSQ